jgi:hypothetical protein
LVVVEAADVADVSPSPLLQPTKHIDATMLIIATIAKTFFISNTS